MCEARFSSDFRVGEGSNYVGSDINAFLEYTRRAVILDDDEYVILTQESYQIRSLRDGQQVEKDILHIDSGCRDNPQGWLPTTCSKKSLMNLRPASGAKDSR